MARTYVHADADDMNTGDDLPLTEDQRLRARIHNLVDRVQEQGGQIREHRALIDQLAKKNPDASQLRFTSGVVFTIVLSALGIGGMLWRVDGRIETMDARYGLILKALDDRITSNKEALDREERDRRLQFFEFKEAQKENAKSKKGQP